VIDGFSFERTAHLLHFRSEDVAGRFRAVGVPLAKLERRSAILLDGREIPYPFQYNLWATPGAIARAVLAEIKDSQGRERPLGSFADMLTAAWGETAVAYFFRPYNEKLWGRPLEDLPADCAGAYLPPVDVELVEQGLRRPVHYRGYNGMFSFPESGRLGDVMDALAAPLGCIRYHAGVASVDLDRHELNAVDGSTTAYRALISTLPLGQLVRMAGIEAAPALFAATEIVNVRVGLRGRLRTPWHWLYAVDPHVPFHRINFPSNVNPRTCPPGCVSISIEYTVPPDRAPDSASVIAEAALDYLDGHGLVDAHELVVVSSATIAPAYVVQRAPGRATFTEIGQILAEYDVVLAGRFGTWDYLSIEEAFTSGICAANECLATVAA
jgi:protoporphyrinogen oxidase